MTITTYTDREIALRQQLAAMTDTATEYQQAADKMAMEHKVERDTLRQQLAEAQALIEAIRQQRVVAWWIPKAEQFCLQSKSGERPFAKAWEPLFAAPVVAPDVPNMFWNADDNEKMHTSISEFLNDEICNGTPLEVGAIFTIQQAKRLPDIRIKVTSIDDNECEADYEVIDAAIGGAND